MKSDPRSESIGFWWGGKSIHAPRIPESGKSIRGLEPWGMCGLRSTIGFEILVSAPVPLKPGSPDGGGGGWQVCLCDRGGLRAIVGGVVVVGVRELG